MEDVYEGFIGPKGVVGSGGWVSNVARWQPHTKPIRAFRKKQAEALAEIVLHVDIAQLSFIKDDDPKTVWEGLLGIHQARGMASRLALCR